MLRKIVLFTIACLTFIISKSQSFDGGLLLGMSASQIEGDTYSGYNKFGVMGGVFVKNQTAGKLCVQTEIKFLQKGSQRVSADGGFMYQARLNYVEIPLIFSIKTNLKKIFKKDKDVYFEFGGAAAYLISAQENLNNYGWMESKDFNAFDFNGTIGFIYPFSDSWAANLRFAYSVVPIRERGGNNYYFRNAQFNNVLTLALYYTFKREK